MHYIVSKRKEDPMQVDEKLIRKQFLVSNENVLKLNSLAQKESVSAGEIVRRSILAYDPSFDREKELEQLINQMGAALQKANETISRTQNKLDTLLETLTSESNYQRIKNETKSWINSHPEEFRAIQGLFI